MNKIKKLLWMTLGFICLGCAYIGVVTPGIPFSIFLVIAAFSFAKSNRKMHDWIMNHKMFGPFLRNWGTYRIFPQKAKYLMIITMLSTLVIMYIATGNLNALMWSSAVMALVAIWAWKYPSTKKIHDTRKKEGKRIAWIK
jgi:hypothetical protein|tara:strand:- start:176 stop:595 length:420 start_codon:yes stop_codon:yes gene_type:complete